MSGRSEVEAAYEADRRTKNEVDGIGTREGKRDAIKKGGMLLADDELEMVSGGVHREWDDASGKWTLVEDGSDSMYQ